MKKLILILLLFIANVNAQSNLLLLMGDEGGYDKDAIAYFDALATPLSETRQDTINMFIVMLKDTLGIANLSDFFDRLWIFASPTTTTALNSVVNPTSTDATNVGSATFTVDRGYTPAYNKYINSQFNPNTDATNYTLNSAAIGVYSRTDNTNAGCQMGSWENASIRTSMYVTSATGQPTGLGINSAVTNGTAGTVSNSQGTFIISRVASNSRILTHNGVSIFSDIGNSTDIPDYVFYIGQLNNAGSSAGYDTKEIAIAFISKGITVTQARGIHNCFEWFLDAIGAGVIP